MVHYDVLKSNKPILVKAHLKAILKSYGSFGHKNLTSRLETSYTLANDAHLTCDFSANIEGLNHLEVTVHTRSLGLVVGNGYIHSVLPNIPASDILLCDVDYRVHNYIFYLTELMLDTQASASHHFDTQKEVILNQLYSAESNPFYYDGFQQNFEREIARLGHLHFLSSPERFEQCVTALKTKTILPININLFDSGQVSKLSHALEENTAEISFLNLSNIRNYDSIKKMLSANISMLPVQNDAKVLWSYIPASASASLATNKLKLINSYLSHSVTEFEETYKKIAFQYTASEGQFFHHKMSSLAASKTQADMQVNLSFGTA